MLLLSLFATSAVGQDPTPGTVEWYQAAYPWFDTPEEDLNPNLFQEFAYCDLTDNSDGTFPTNPACNNAGTCELFNIFQPVNVFSWGKCECANTEAFGNFVYNDPRWVYQTFTGPQCKDFTFQLYSVMSYLIHITEYSPSSAQYQGVAGIFECDKGPEGEGVTITVANQADALPNPDFTPLVWSHITYNEYYAQTATASAGLTGAGYVNYKGKVVAWQRSSVETQHCKTCNDNEKCEIDGTTYGDDGNGGYLLLSYATNFNTYYNRTCEKVNGIMPIDQAGAENEPNCDANYDGGASALHSWELATHGNNDEATIHKTSLLALAQEPTSTEVFNCDNAPSMSTPCIDDFTANGLGFTNIFQIQRTSLSEQSAQGIATRILTPPTQSPTFSPTGEPTGTPTPGDYDCFEYGYTHQMEDMKFMAISEDSDRGCRWGLDLNWPGGDETDMCDSPYVVCLPEENTPNVGFPMPSDGLDANGLPNKYEDYQANDAPYTIEMCKRECAFDQRCNGFEYVPTDVTGDIVSGSTGTCKLIDDIPVVATSPGGNSAAPSITTEADLAGVTSTGDLNGGVVCYEKDAACNPYFTEGDLSDIMLNCYCPNNRKGFYTKNVVRTVASTTFCGDDPDGAITRRIREAQANRMFHLCENWCLFNTQNPRTESWYHDPWTECWREQYAGVGTHRSYCYRVIRDPFTIEQFFIDTRSQNMCDAVDTGTAGNFSPGNNTPSPVMGPVSVDTWVLAPEEDSCDDACDAAGLVCAQEGFMTILNGATSEAQSAFLAAGYDCESAFVESNTESPNGSHGWALPALADDGSCVTRHEDANKQGWGADDLYTGCSVAVGVGYQRLCSCGTPI